MFSQALQHATNFFATAATVHALALVIVNLTKTPKDDEYLSKIYRVIEILAGIVTKLAKK
jgi:hypothetical protein